MSRKGESKYEEFRGPDGKIDYKLAEAWKKKQKRDQLGSVEQRRQIILNTGKDAPPALICPVCRSMMSFMIKKFPDGTPAVDEDSYDGYVYITQSKYRGINPVVCRDRSGNTGLLPIRK